MRAHRLQGRVADFGARDGRACWARDGRVLRALDLYRTRSSEATRSGRRFPSRISESSCQRPQVRRSACRRDGASALPRSAKESAPSLSSLCLSPSLFKTAVAETPARKLSGAAARRQCSSTRACRTCAPRTATRASRAPSGRACTQARGATLIFGSPHRHNTAGNLKVDRIQVYG